MGDKRTSFLLEQFLLAFLASKQLILLNCDIVWCLDFDSDDTCLNDKVRLGIQTVFHGLKVVAADMFAIQRNEIVQIKKC